MYLTHLLEVLYSVICRFLQHSHSLTHAHTHTNTHTHTYTYTHTHTHTGLAAKGRILIVGSGNSALDLCAGLLKAQSMSGNTCGSKGGNDIESGGLLR